ncbi:13567_t:CDS:10 [Ambispora leptoticha]|uniref:13567_t:CDS:1 n=1 Tax=Ambispora leptoticha TaxID=144679 RepID=A0A9N8VEV8_9GLOM|nr:13567_t:CDS:10 [Ambispora leptoticha]
MGKTKKSRSSNPLVSSSLPSDNRIDLTQLLTSPTGAPSEDDVLQLLSNRYKADLPYTRINASTLVVVNPHKPLECMNDATAKDYAEQWYKDTSGNKSSLQPHVYELAARVYLHMRRSAEDQSVIFSGISGSGKTASQSHFLQQLLLLSTHTKKESKIASLIENAQFILEAFGNAQTVQNRNASRFGKYLELQFNERGRIIGAKGLTYALDKSRVTEVPQDERSYHVFYYLLAGANAEEKSQFHLQDPQNYFYLSQSKCFRISDVDDTIKMDDLRASLKTLGFKSKTVSQIWQLLSAILLLGNIEFVNPGRNARDEAASIKNHHVLDSVAEQLGVPSSKLEQTLTYKTKYIRKELCTVFLNAEAAAEQRDSLARALYSILFTWIVEHINSKLCNSDEPPNFIGLLDQPGYQNFTKNSFEQFCLNVASEEIENFVLKNLFDDTIGGNAEINRDGVSLPRVLTMDNSGCVELLRGNDYITSTNSNAKKTGLVSILDQESFNVQNGREAGDDANLLSTLQKTFSSHSSYVANAPNSKFSKAGSFGINHFAGQVNYSIDNFIDKNLDNLSTDFVNLFRDTNNPFVSKLFSGPALAIENHPRNEKTIVMAQLPTKPMRAPSMKKRKTRETTDLAATIEEEKSGKKKHSAEVSTVITQLYGTLNQLIETMNETRMWNIIQIRPNDNHEPNSFDNKRVKAQIRSFLIPDIVNRKRVDYTAHYSYSDFIARYESIFQSYNLDPSRSDRQKVEAFVTLKGWGEGDIAFGRQNVFLSDPTWKELEDTLRAAEKEERARAKQTKDDESLASGFNGGGERPRGLAAASATSSMDRLIPTQRPAYGSDFYDDQSYAGSEDEYYSRSGGNAFNGEEEEAMWGSQWGGNSGDGATRDGDLKQGNEKGAEDDVEEELPITKTRIWWVRFVWFMTWWIPSFCLSWIGGMKRADVQMAWREKLVLCMIIFLMSAIIIFYIIFFGNLICPGNDKVFSAQEVGYHTGDNDFWVSLRGKIYDISSFWQMDHSDVSGFPAASQQMQDFAGTDVTPFFPIPIAEACQGLNLNDPNNIIKLQVNTTNASPFGFKHEYPSRIYPNSKLSRPDWYTGTFIPRMKGFYKADLVWDKNDIADQARTQNRKWAIINKRVYDLSDYFTTQKFNQQQNAPEGNAPLPIPNYHFLDNDVETLFNSLPGQDISSYWSRIDPTTRAYNLACMENLFFVGRIDFRKTFRCQFNNYILLAVSVILMSVVLIKFLAALQLGSRRKPEEHDKFVICQVPCYTEGEDSLKRTMDSLAALVYDDKRKLLFLIADGMIIGSGNDRPTPRIVLDILGVDPKMDPEPLAFKSVGEGSAQLNYGKVYSGLYEYEGHVVPYIVVVKVGKPSELSRPGNRGKRDSQIILMGFLNKVHFDLEMTPLELEIYHQMKNVIGVNPTFYEYILMVDADTEVLPDSLNRMVSCMLHDGRIIGICGETTLIDEEGSWTTMIQVYEYYISHHLAKAFESLFGSVTCLPGCFCMYRIRTPNKGTPLIISKLVIDDYSENHVDTLHKKNLLSLGEDRYLTTLMMKHFPQYKMTFTPDAQCKTAAPDRWGILLSQRRRWINSTIHNLMELMFLPEMCGFCCFSMRFVVFIDLFGTLILPSTVVYIIYLVYAVATRKQTLPIIALAMLAAVYGLQAVIFILKRQWQHIGWMIIYLLAFPLFSFFIPVYAFWHFDDFSWGNTRMVVSEKGKKQIINNEEEKFDEKMIPKKKWADYEQEMWEVGTTVSHESRVSRGSAASYHSRGSQHNYETGSQYGSQYGGSQYGGGDYYRDTNLAYRDSNLAASGRRNRSRSPVPKYTSDYRSSRAFSNVGGDHISEPRSSMLLSRDLEALASRPLSSYSSPADGPTDEEILQEIRNILANANLMSITKKQVREQLTQVFGVDMTSRKEFINNSIELTLQDVSVSDNQTKNDNNIYNNQFYNVSDGGYSSSSHSVNDSQIITYNEGISDPQTSSDANFAVNFSSYQPNYQDSVNHSNKNMYIVKGDVTKPITLPPQAEDTLSVDMLSLYETLLPTAESAKRREYFVNKIETLLNDEYPEHSIKVHLFGSSMNDLGSSNSDVDLCVTTEWNGLEKVQTLAKVFRRLGMKRVNCVPKAKVPIVRLWDPELHLACDLNVNNTLALHNTRLIKTYVNIDPRVRPLAMILKHWAKRRALNDAAKGGTLSTYTWTIMILNFLQMREPPILPVLHQIDTGTEHTFVDGFDASFYDDVESLRGFGDANKESIGGLLFAFFRRFAFEFDYEHHVISIRQGKYLTKAEKNWDSRGWLLCVEEPFNTARNLGNSADVVTVKGLIGEFKRAFNILYDKVSLEICCRQYYFPKFGHNQQPLQLTQRSSWNNYNNKSSSNGKRETTNNYSNVNTKYQNNGHSIGGSGDKRGGGGNNYNGQNYVQSNPRRINDYKNNGRINGGQFNNSNSSVSGFQSNEHVNNEHTNGQYSNVRKNNTNGGRINTGQYNNNGRGGNHNDNRHVTDASISPEHYNIIQSNINNGITIGRYIGGAENNAHVNDGRLYYSITDSEDLQCNNNNPRNLVNEYSIISQDDARLNNNKNRDSQYSTSNTDSSQFTHTGPGLSSYEFHPSPNGSSADWHSIHSNSTDNINNSGRSNSVNSSEYSHNLHFYDDDAYNNKNMTSEELIKMENYTKKQTFQSNSNIINNNARIDENQYLSDVVEESVRLWVIKSPDNSISDNNNTDVNKFNNDHSTYQPQQNREKVLQVANVHIPPSQQSLSPLSSQQQRGHQSQHHHPLQNEQLGFSPPSSSKNLQNGQQQQSRGNDGGIAATYQPKQRPQQSNQIKRQNAHQQQYYHGVGTQQSQQIMQIPKESSSHYSQQPQNDQGFPTPKESYSQQPRGIGVVQYQKRPQNDQLSPKNLQNVQQQPRGAQSQKRLQNDKLLSKKVQHTQRVAQSQLRSENNQQLVPTPKESQQHVPQSRGSGQSQQRLQNVQLVFSTPKKSSHIPQQFRGSQQQQQLLHIDQLGFPSPKKVQQSHIGSPLQQQLQNDQLLFTTLKESQHMQQSHPVQSRQRPHNNQSSFPSQNRGNGGGNVQYHQQSQNDQLQNYQIVFPTPRESHVQQSRNIQSQQRLQQQNPGPPLIKESSHHQPRTNDQFLQQSQTERTSNFDLGFPTPKESLHAQQQPRNNQPPLQQPYQPRNNNNDDDYAGIQSQRMQPKQKNIKK